MLRDLDPAGDSYHRAARVPEVVLLRNLGEHEWETLASLTAPDDKILMPGVIDTKTNVVEHPRLITQRIARFAEIVGRERVIPGTDCGFATFAGFGMVDPGVAWMKLAEAGHPDRPDDRAGSWVGAELVLLGW